MAGHRPIFFIVGSLSFATALLALYAGWTHLRTRPGGNRVKIVYETFCRKAARLGASRNASEGPVDLSARATRFLPNESDRILRIADTFIALRHATAPDPRTLEPFAKD